MSERDPVETVLLSKVCSQCGWMIHKTGHSCGPTHALMKYSQDKALTHYRKVKAELADCRERYDCLDANYRAMLAKRDAMKTENDRIKAELRWYGDKARALNPPREEYTEEAEREAIKALEQDGGDRARKALEDDHD